ncbi:PAS domain-containing response regulator [Halorussus amylolyticus]|uniref:PAS domain-containing response regulator n=1 Tax=Halorussus amylolyticus TaxID=1126242 RepID=UPI0010517590|nr:PAS domain S-box protein [Halorussus amylolyticus]
MDATIRVLHVEDDENIAELTAEFLERENDRLDVDTEANPVEGIKRLDDTEVDCIVSDHDMPEKNGIEFLKSVRESYPDLPFILFTGKGSEEVASKAISAGVSDYLQKQARTEQYEILANRIVNNVERAHAQRELEERKSHLQQAQLIADLGSWENDIFADKIYWSDTVYDIFRIDDSETCIDHDQFLDYVHPADRAAVDAAWSAALDGEEYDIEHRIVTEDGETRWIRERAEVTVDDTGSPTKALGVVQDITERKEREDRLQQTSARLRALFDQSPDMINFHDSDGRIIDPNPRLCERTGYSEAELTDMAVWDLDKEIDADEATSIWKEMSPGESQKLESTYQCRDGSTFPVEVHIRCFDQENSDHFVVISHERSRPTSKASEHRQSETSR